MSPGLGSGVAMRAANARARWERPASARDRRGLVVAAARRAMVAWRGRRPHGSGARGRRRSRVCALPVPTRSSAPGAAAGPPRDSRRCRTPGWGDGAMVSRPRGCEGRSGSHADAGWRAAWSGWRRAIAGGSPARRAVCRPRRHHGSRRGAASAARCPTSGAPPPAATCSVCVGNAISAPWRAMISPIFSSTSCFTWWYVTHTVVRVKV